MMNIRIWRGVLKVPIKLFYVIILVFILLCALCVEYLQQWKTSPQPACASHRPEQKWSNGSKLSGAQHFPCVGDPIVFNTWESCPECFRSTVELFSRNFSEVFYGGHTFPRGTPGYFKPRKTKQQDLIDKVLITPSSVCVGTCPYLVAIQLSVSDRADERAAIRVTWGSVAKTKIWPHACLNADFEIMFVLAHKSNPTEGANVSDEVRREAERYGDILYLDMIDSYFNLTLKLISTLHWVRDHCPRTKFFLKVDSDTFVNVPLLLDLLIYNEGILEYSITGHIYVDERYVFRSGRWGVSKALYPIHMFPVYASGCAYVISTRALRRVVELFPYMPMLSLEDVYITGILGRAAKLRYFPHDLPGVFTDFHSDKWEWCQFLNDTLATGTGVNRIFKKYVLWSGFLLNDWVCMKRNLLTLTCYCEEEFPGQPSE